MKKKKQMTKLERYSAPIRTRIQLDAYDIVQGSRLMRDCGMADWMQMKAKVMVDGKEEIKDFIALMLPADYWFMDNQHTLTCKMLSNKALMKEMEEKSK